MAAASCGPRGSRSRSGCMTSPFLNSARRCGIYDVSANAGFVNVGISADTGEFSVASIRRWWREIGAPRYPEAKQLLINADCGCSNGARLRLCEGYQGH